MMKILTTVAVVSGNASFAKYVALGDSLLLDLVMEHFS
jgi:hypothetical protein